MSFWKTDKPRHTTFDEKALQEGGLGDVVQKVIAGESVPAAVVETMMEGKMDDSKPVVASKINWTALAMAAATATQIPAFNDPQVVAALANVETFIPAQWMPWIVIGANAAIFVFRTWFTKKAVAGLVVQQ